MAVSSFRSQVLASFKKLHQTRMTVFKDDHSALQGLQVCMSQHTASIESAKKIDKLIVSAAREKINEEFKKNMHVQNSTSINELVLYAQSVEVELRTSVVQAREVERGYFEARLTEDTKKLNNVPFKDCPS